MNNCPYPYLNILVFPTTACNLRCKYCFHANNQYREETMDSKFLQRMFSLLFPHYKYLQFIWHGGEPLCAGFTFFQDMLSLQKTYAQQFNVEVDNGLMTNATLVTEEIAEFFYENNFDIGVSYDGIHNELLRGQTQKVLKGLEILNKHHCNPDIVTVITNLNLRNQIENYQHIKTLAQEVKFNPVAPIGGAAENGDCQLDPALYSDECCRMFDYWLEDMKDPCILEPYYQYLRDILEGTSSGCQRTSCLGRWIAIHPNGDVYPCVREGRTPFRFGNIFEIDDIREIWQSDAFLQLVEGSIVRREKCTSCPFYLYCQGGCPVNASHENGLTNNGGFSCVTFKRIFGHVYEACRHLLALSSEERRHKFNPIVCALFEQHQR